MERALDCWKWVNQLRNGWVLLGPAGSCWVLAGSWWVLAGSWWVLLGTAGSLVGPWWVLLGTAFSTYRRIKL